VRRLLSRLRALFSRGTEPPSPHWLIYSLFLWSQILAIQLARGLLKSAQVSLENMDACYRGARASGLTTPELDARYTEMRETALRALALAPGRADGRLVN